ncbi:hypothetical protein RB623_02970 [Mesorhizobium sp. LHD-90]|uniref:hypothetical protein n=1 Tax=Mesorhizobium sp. LHD-90 TaxID=3071414 RepID=UPI0027E20378|nr:hypothetical protein [Mesorhizobium sp. LHD-90]MDQ6433013.1 hypothetical protein [Mesorhizobium sp. LHD-90]
MDMMRQPPTSFKSDTFEIVAHPASSKLIVFFSATGTKPGQFNFWKDGNKLDCHRMFVQNGRNEWYQSGVPGLGSSIEETVATIRRWADFLGATEIYTAGGSMGAYAAILYGSLLKARVLAYSAEIILRIPHSRSENLMVPGNRVIYPDLSGHIAQSAAPIYGFYGEMDAVDIYCANIIQRSPNMKITTFRHVEHNTPEYLRDVGLLSKHLNSFLTNKPICRTPADGRVLEYPDFPSLYLRTYQAFRQSKWAASVSLGKQALSIYRASELCQHMVGHALWRQGQPIEALPHLSIAKILNPDHVPFRSSLATCLSTLGYLGEAIDLRRETLRLVPDHARTRYNLGLALEKNGDRDLAKLEFMHAAKLEPTNAAFLRKAGMPTTVTSDE